MGEKAKSRKGCNDYFLSVVKLLLLLDFISLGEERREDGRKSKE